MTGSNLGHSPAASSHAVARAVPDVSALRQSTRSKTVNAKASQLEDLLHSLTMRSNALQGQLQAQAVSATSSAALGQEETLESLEDALQATGDPSLEHHSCVLQLQDENQALQARLQEAREECTSLRSHLNAAVAQGTSALRERDSERLRADELGAELELLRAQMDAQRSIMKESEEALVQQSNEIERLMQEVKNAHAWSRRAASRASFADCGTAMTPPRTQVSSPCASPCSETGKPPISTSRRRFGRALSDTGPSSSTPISRLNLGPATSPVKAQPIGSVRSKARVTAPGMQPKEVPAAAASRYEGTSSDKGESASVEREASAGCEPQMRTPGQLASWDDGTGGGMSNSPLIGSPITSTAREVLPTEGDLEPEAELDARYASLLRSAQQVTAACEKEAKRLEGLDAPLHNRITERLVRKAPGEWTVVAAPFLKPLVAKALDDREAASGEWPRRVGDGTLPPAVAESSDSSPAPIRLSSPTPSIAPPAAGSSAAGGLYPSVLPGLKELSSAYLLQRRRSRPLMRTPTPSEDMPSLGNRVK